LLSPLVNSPDVLLRSRHARGQADAQPVVSLLEVPCLAGVIDVVHARIDLERLAHRQLHRLDTLPDRRDVLTVLLLQRLRGSVSVEVLAAASKVSVKRLASVVAPRLVGSGWVSITDGAWTLKKPYSPAVRDVTVVEAKVNDLWTGVSQARRYAPAAEAVFVAVDEAAVSRVSAAKQRLRACGVGAVTVRPATQGRAETGQDAVAPVRVHVKPGRQRLVDDLARAHLAETVLHMHLQGRASGPVRPVFGAWLLSSAADPRLADASA
jgi:hypothetical protein